MSDAWAIAVLSAALGWGAWELRAIRNTLSRFVDKDDCSAAMSGHCLEIRNLWSEIRKQGERIARLEK
jgi:hypothetical protein